MIKNIIFDVGKVLVEFKPEKTMKEIGIAEDKIEDLVNATCYNPLWGELDRGVMKEEDVIAKMIEQAPALEEEIKFFFANAKELLVTSFPYAAPWLKELQERGYKVYLLSNYPESFFEIHSKSRFTFLSYIDGKIVSGVVKMVKPDVDIYQCLMDTFSLKAEECVFLDDRQENIDTAKALGMQGITFVNQEEACKQLEELL